MIKDTDVVIVGTGAAGLFCALHFPEDIKVLMITKDTVDKSDSFLAQGGMCMLRDEKDYEEYFEDTMRAGHYENNKNSVDIMIRSSQKIASELMEYGVEFEKDNGGFIFTREGGHSHPRILFHKDITGKEITSKLLYNASRRKNIEILEYTSMLDIICDSGNVCRGIVVCGKDGSISAVRALYTVLACGGLGGLYKHSTNFRHITGDALAIAYKHNIEVDHIDYIQIHPTTLYSEKPGRRFLISESVRGEGAVLLNKDKKRFCNELNPRDIVTADIRKQMEKDNMPYVWLSMENIPENEIRAHFPNILDQCLKEGYNPVKECIPVVPAQHYFMGGIKTDSDSMSSMPHLYAVGETSCNGVHGRNRLASNSLLESMVFAERAAEAIQREMFTGVALYNKLDNGHFLKLACLGAYNNIEALKAEYKERVLSEIEKENKRHE
ncbi:MAG: L-aspartate oxidase [Lachnospiraceae bacterium]